MQMLSALVLHNVIPRAREPAEPAVRTLAALVPAAMEGVLRDVVVAGPAAAGLAKVADHAGCVYVVAESEAEQIARGGAALRGALAFVIRAGAMPEPGFVEELDDLLRDGGRAALMRAAPVSFAQRLLPNLAPVSALVVARDVLVSGRAPTFAALVRLARPAPTLRTRARAFR